MRAAADRRARPRTCGLLRDPTASVDIAFVQGGADHEPARRDDDGRRRRPGLARQPVLRAGLAVLPRRLGRAPAQGARADRLAQLAGWRVNVGAPRQRRAEPDGAADRRPTSSTAARSRCCATRRRRRWSALLDGEHRRGRVRLGARVADGADAAADAGHPPVRFRPGRSLCAPLPFLSPVTLPRGVVDLAQRPAAAATCRLVAPTASLVARERHPPGADPAVRAGGAGVHGGAGWFQRKGDFPNARNTERPLAKEAAALLHRAARPCCSATCRSGSRTWSTACGWRSSTIVAVLLPLSRILPPLYTFRIRSRVFRWYRQLREVEERDRPAAERRAAARARRRSSSASSR